MKLLHFDDFRLGVLKGDHVVDVTSLVQGIPHSGPGDRLSSLIARWNEFRGPIEQVVAGATGVPLNSVRLRPPLATSTAWRSTTWKTARAANRRRSMPFTRQ